MKNLKRLLAVTLACSLILGCEPESFFSSNEELESHYELNRDDVKLLDYYASIGIDAFRLVFDSTTCVIDGDMVIDKERMLQLIKNIAIKNPSEGVGTIPELRQYGVDSDLMAVSASNVSNIKYFIHSSVNNCVKAADWKSAILAAAKKWNDITNCRINFIQVTNESSANLIISSDEASNTFLNAKMINLALGTLAKTYMPAPTLGSICKYISIRKGSDPSNRLNVIMHEFGHSLGYYHSSGVDGIHIHGTPTSDNSSVMYETVSSNTIFTTGDLRAARIYYPDIIFAIGGFNIVPDGIGRVKISITAPSSSYPVYWLQVERWNSTLSTMIKKTYIKCSGTSFYLSDIPKGTYAFRVCGANFRKDVTSDFTIYKTLSVQ